MSDIIKHECGLGFVRLLKPLSYYQDKYGTSLYGLHIMQLLLQKQRNRGQDGAGLATIKLGAQPGYKYISRKRSNSPNYIKDLFSGIFSHFDDLLPEQLSDPEWLKQNKPYTGEVILGHLRYGTHGDDSIETVHPFLRQSNWISRNLVLAGNFNMTNVEELFSELIDYGQYPKEQSDTVTVLEKIGHFLDEEVQRLFNWFKPEGLTKQEINQLIFDHLDLQRVLRRATRKFDGGYVMAGMVGHGDAFILRDPSGIRPAFFYHDDEIVALASERPALQTALDVRWHQVKELERGHALIVKHHGDVAVVPVMDQLPRNACSFERIYFSRGTDRDIYLERKKLGESLIPQVVESIEGDFENTVFSFIPNTSEIAFLGLIQGLERHLNVWKKKKILELGATTDEGEIEAILNQQIRVEKIVNKDVKMRTFIANDLARGDLVSHVYDVTYGIVKNEVDTLVLLDDSIVRGTTLRDSILQIVSRLKPKKIIILSSAPQIRYPDCYGIDMSKMKDFAAFRALVTLLEDSGQEQLMEDAYNECLRQMSKPPEEWTNPVKKLYEQFDYKTVSERIAKILTPPNISIPIEVQFQTLEGLHDACPHNNGDWYFSGNYPTPGGTRVVQRAFMNYMEKKDVRAY
jgi:amidophosphoribosyltransferase